MKIKGFYYNYCRRLEIEQVKLQGLRFNRTYAAEG
jgi:hypothetical protein